jgi:hypothetical protein
MGSIASDVLENIAKMDAVDNVLYLPKDEMFKNYAAVKKTLINAGGKYKSNTFVFPNDAAEIRDRLTGGEVLNDKKKFQFFTTPPALVDILIDAADIQSHHCWLEPSAGHGAIADKLETIAPNLGMLAELNPECREVLNSKGYVVHMYEFLTDGIPQLRFDRIVANPPFTNNQDIDHVMHMLTMLKPGGRLVSVMSTSWTFGMQKKQVAFRELMDELNAEINTIPVGMFKSSGTNIATCYIVIDKE